MRGPKPVSDPHSSTDADRIKGMKSSQTEAVLGYRGREEMIHRDDLVLS